MDCFLSPPPPVRAATSPCCCCDHPRREDVDRFHFPADSAATDSSSSSTSLQHPLMHYPSNGYEEQSASKDEKAIAKPSKVRSHKRTLSFGASNLEFDASNIVDAEGLLVEEEEEDDDDDDEAEEEEGEKKREKEKLERPEEERRIDDSSRLRRRASMAKISMLTCYVITIFLSAFTLLPFTNAEAEPRQQQDLNRVPRDVYGGGDDEDMFAGRFDAVTHVAVVVGSDVALPCLLAGAGNSFVGLAGSGGGGGGGGDDDDDARLKWVKRNRVSKETITEGEHIVVDNWEKRFELGRDNYTLFIRNVELQDGSRYQCTTVGRPMVDGKEKGKRQSSTVFLTVFEPPHCQAWDPLGTGEWAAGDINFGGECSTVTRGGVKPSLEWSRASTGQTGLGTSDIYPGDPPQILSSYYFKPSHEDQGTNLTCELFHPHLNPEDVGKFTCVIGPMEILFDVIFFCDSEQFVDPRDAEFNVTCDVWANPPVDPNHIWWIPQNLDKPPLSDLINTSNCWQMRQESFQQSSYKVEKHVTRTTMTVDKHLDKFVDSIDFILQARRNSKKNVSMLILDPNAERRMIQGFDEDLFISMLMIVIGGVIVLTALLVVFIFGAYDWYQSFRPRDYDYGYEKLRKIEATKRFTEKAEKAAAAASAANSASSSNTAAATAAATTTDANKPQTRVPSTASAVNRRLHNRHSMISSLSS